MNINCLNFQVQSKRTNLREEK